jgi:hypothetical protein
MINGTACVVGVDFEDAQATSSWQALADRRAHQIKKHVHQHRYGFHVGCQAVQTLRKAGFDARYMAGGHFAWKAIKGPVKPPTPKPEPKKRWPHASSVLQNSTKARHQRASNFYCSVKITTVPTPCRSAASGATEHGTELRRLNRWKQKWLVGGRGGIRRPVCKDHTVAAPTSAPRMNRSAGGRSGYEARRSQQLFS